MSNGYQFGEMIAGFFPADTSNAFGTQQINAAGAWYGFPFIAIASKTISKVKIRVSAVGGTLGANDLECHIFSDVAATGVPNASLSNSNTVTAVPSGAAWVEFTGLSQAITAGTRYHIIIKNVNGSPSTNFPTLTWQNTTYGAPFLGSPTTWMSNLKTTTNSGSSWGNGTGGVIFPFRIEFNDGSFFGFPIESSADDTTNIVYSGRRVGSKITTPNNATLRVAGISMAIGFSGSPTGFPLYSLYNNTTLIGSTNQVDNKSKLTSSCLWFPLYFSTVQVVPPGTALRVVLAESSQSDGNTNYYKTRKFTVENDSNSRLLMPFGGCVQTYFDGSSWADTNTSMCPFTLILDNAGQFLSQQRIYSA